MARFTGTSANESITPTGVSSTVSVVPAGSIPSAAADIIDGVDGKDTIDGGGGNDTISFSGAGSTARGSDGNDTIAFNVPDRTAAISGFADGGGGNDAISFDVPYSEDGAVRSGTITLRGGEGADTISGYAGFESSPRFENVDVYMYGDGGNDRLDATIQFTGSSYMPDAGANNRDFLYGGAGDDFYHVQETKDVVVENAGEGYDTVEVNNSSTGSYTLAPNVERLVVWDWYWHLGCTLTGNEQANVIIGTAVGNTLNGMGGDDTIYGKPANYELDEPDDDTIHGGNGNDLIYGAGSGSDTWDGDDLIYGDAGNDTLHGVIGNDAMFGGDGTDVMFGGEGNDTMDGGAGNDDVRGQNGTDTLIGGAGLDRLMGGAGNDVFDYNALTDSRPTATYRDVITTAFDGVGAAAGDRVDLATIDANTGSAGNQAFAFRGTGAITAASQVRVAALGTDTLVQANVGGTLAADMEILVRDGTALPGQWAAGDFVL